MEQVADMRKQDGGFAQGESGICPMHLVNLREVTLPMPHILSYRNAFLGKLLPYQQLSNFALSVPKLMNLQQFHAFNVIYQNGAIFHKLMDLSQSYQQSAISCKVQGKITSRKLMFL
jgi:hypothetical protein